jgi:ribosomal protein S18 acetylase RimI-like enzyme
MELRAADGFSLAELTRIWNLGYTGYFVSITFTEEMMAGWMRNGDFDLAHSVVAMDGENPMGFSLLGVRGRRGWIGGFGVSPDYRGQGLAQRLFAEHIARVEEQTDLRTVQLEVLTENWARKVYERAGFAVVRRLGVMQGVPGTAARAGAGGAEAGTGAAGAGARPKMAPPVALLAHHYRLHGGCRAVWQREISWLEKTLPATAEGLYTGTLEAPTGYLIVAPAGEGVRIADGIALTEADAADLVAMLTERYPGKSVSAVNEPDDGPLYKALVAAGVAEARSQWEMLWTRL